MREPAGTSKAKKHMKKININGSVTTDPFNILSEQRRFYQELYASTETRIRITHKRSKLS